MFFPPLNPLNFSKHLNLWVDPRLSNILNCKKRLQGKFYCFVCGRGLEQVVFYPTRLVQSREQTPASW